MNLNELSICRTCFKNIPQNESTSISPENDNNSSILEILSFTIPELNIFLVTSPVICKSCTNLLKLCFEFKMECLKNEEHLLKYSHNNNNNISIKDIPPLKLMKRPVSERYTILNKERSNIRKAPPLQKPNQTNSLLNCDKCYGCKYKLSDSSKHQKVYVPPPFICYTCNKETDNIQDMRKHLMGHFRSRKCKICQKHFRDLSQLKTHFRVHTGVNPYKCDICSKSFRQKHSLTQHLNQHTGSESVSCKYCNKVFSTKYNAQVHMRSVHRTLQKCDLCGERFNTKTELVNHLETSTETCRGGEIKTENSEDNRNVITSPSSYTSNINLSSKSPICYEFVIPQSSVKKLIGVHGGFASQIKDTTNAVIIVRPHPTQTKLKICSVEGIKFEVENALKMIREKFPIKRYPEITLKQVHLTTAVPVFSEHIIKEEAEDVQIEENIYFIKTETVHMEAMDSVQENTEKKILEVKEEL